MNELDKLIEELIKEKGGTKKQYLHLLNSVAKHETGGTNSPTQKQVGGGPGRGKYQFGIGRHKGGITAAKRLQRYYQNNKKPVPQWLKTVTKGNDLDASTLTGEQQDLLFLGNMREHPRADLSKVMSGEQSIPEFWVDNHWSGPKRQRQVRLKSFNSTYEPIEQSFDPEGSGYDYKTADKYNIQPDETGHYPSRVPQTGRLLKGRKHETYHKTVDGEKKAGYEIYKGDDNNYYSRKQIKQPQLKPQDGTFVPAPNIKSLRTPIQQQDTSLPNNQLAYGGPIRGLRQYSTQEDAPHNGIETPIGNIDYYDDKVRKSRTSGRPNADGTHSSVIMSQADNMAFPTLFQNKDKSWTQFEQNNWRGALDRAKQQNEVYRFSNETDARNFAEGNWKQSNQLAYGGQSGTAQYQGAFSQFGVGGNHETNSNGGIPMGPNASVEQNETSFNFKNLGKFIFSDRVGSDGIMKDKPCTECDKKKRMALGGLAPDQVQVGNPPPTNNNKVSVEDYQKAISQGNYHDYSTPYPEGISKETMFGNNCINGVCTVINDALGDKTPLDKSYTGNMTFEDNARNLGYYPIRRRQVKKFYPGDVLQYQGLKSTKFKPSGDAMFPNAKEADTFPFHSSLVRDVYVDDNGKTQIVLANNSGTTTMKEKTISYDELMERVRGNQMYPEGVTIQRYNPEEAEAYYKRGEQNQAEIQGENEYAALYNDSQPNIELGDTSTDFSKVEALSTILNPIDKISDTFKQRKVPKELAEAYQKHYKAIGETSNVPPNILDKMFTYQVGIAKQESRFGTSMRKDAKDSIPESIFPFLRDVKESLSFSKNKTPGWIKEYYQANVNGVKSQYSSPKQFAEHIKKKYGDALTDKFANKSAKSKGIFQQKELSARGKHLKGNFDDTEGQFLASMGLMLDNYHIAKKKYPGLKEDKLVDVAALMHNAPQLAAIPEYVNYFIAKEDSDYVNKVKGNTKSSTKQIK